MPHRWAGPVEYLAFIPWGGCKALKRRCNDQMVRPIQGGEAKRKALSLTTIRRIDERLIESVVRVCKNIILHLLKMSILIWTII
jgi:hypothetical protein